MSPPNQSDTPPSEAQESEPLIGEAPQQHGWMRIWQNNKGVFFILLAEVAGSSMDAIVRFLQQGGASIHPFQLMFFRMGVTWILSSLYMWWTQVPDSPLGKSNVRHLLALRASFGFFGLFCLYYSVHYLPLAEATVFRFLVPLVTAYACSIFLHQVFTRKELLAGVIAFIGVIFMAHPSVIFGHVNDIHANGAGPVDKVSPTQRMLAIIASLLGVIGASGAYTMIRVIGNRAHALISVCYFSILGTVGSAFFLLVLPDIGFTMPRDATQWILLLILGILGFVLQFLLTAGLQLDKSSKATSMLYTQVLFALAFDWGIWGVIPGGWSLFGGSIVIASTLWSALQKTPKAAEKNDPEDVDEESALLGAEVQGVEEVQRRASNASSR